MNNNLWNRQFVSLFVINTLNSFGFYMIMSILSKYLTSSGVSLSVAGVIVGLFSITSLIMRPFCGFLSDYMSKVRLLIIALILETVGVLGYALFTSMQVIIAFRIVHGAGFCIVSTALIALAVEYIPECNMGEGIGYMGVSQVIASAIGPGLGIELAEIIGYRKVFLISAVFTLIGVVMVIGLRESFASDIPKVKQGVKVKLSIKNLVAIEACGYTLISAAYSFINGIITAYLLLFAEERGITNIGIYYTVCAVCLFVSKPFSGKLVDRKGLAIAIYPAIIFSGVSMFLLSFSSSIGMIIFSGVLRSIGQGTAMPALQAQCIRQVDKDRSGVATSTYFLGGDVAQGIGPMIGGAVAGVLGYGKMFNSCGILLLLMSIVFYFVNRQGNKTVK